MNRTTTAAAAALWALAVVLTAVVCIGMSADLCHAGGDWNDGGISWRPYQDGLAEASKSGKPVCLVFYTDWCPHCSNYSGVFHDKDVVELAKKFVMIRLNKDQHAELSTTYSPDGQYIPRTYFLSPQGELWKSIHAPRESYVYFYDERNPAGIVAGMRQALSKLGTAK